MADTDTNIGETGIPSLTMTVSASEVVQAPVDATLSISEMPADAKATGDAISAVASDVADNSADIADILAWTGEDINVNSETGSQTIAQAIAGITSEPYPVGTVIMTISDTAPTFNGTWVEIAVTATWNQLKTGLRGYQELEEGQSGGSLHFWLRTE